MNEIEIKSVMAVARPAIWLIYGRQPLKLYAYNILDSRAYISNYDIYMPQSLWVEIASEKGPHYKAKIEKGEVVALTEGGLNV